MTSPGKPVTAAGSVAQVGVHLDQGRAAFNRGAFFAAHEEWEEAWHHLSGVDRAAVQGLIQIAAGCHHLQQGRRGPGLRLLRKGRAKLPNADAETTPGLLAAMDLMSLGVGVSRLLLIDQSEAPDAADASVPDPHGLRL